MAQRKKRKDKAAASDSASMGLSLETPTRVFVSYRREDTAAAVAHLHHSLGQLLGDDKIFRDVDTIQPGQNFEAVIQEAIRTTSVCLVVIGPSWLTVKRASGRRRLDERNDYVRMEIESALRTGVEVIPLLVDGATMPARKELPESIRGLAARNAYELPWASGISKLGDRIQQIERQRQTREAAERVERERLDLTGDKRISPANWRSQSAVVSFNVVVRTMEISLARQGHKVWLSAADLAKSYQSLTKRPLDQGFFAPEIVHLIDFIGVKAKKSKTRYVARSYPVRDFAEIPGQLTLGRPILVGVKVQDSWFKPPITKTGVIDVNAHDRLQGAVLGAVLGWDPANQIVKLLSPWSTWGDRGIATLTRQATEAYLDFGDARSIEAVEKPESPFPLDK
jgi:hypothetical protein